MKYRVIAVNESVTDRPEDWGKPAGFAFEGLDVDTLDVEFLREMETWLFMLTGMKTTITTI